MGDTVDEEQLRNAASRVGLDRDTFEEWLTTVKEFAEFPLQKDKIEHQCVRRRWIGSLHAKCSLADPARPAPNCSALSRVRRALDTLPSRYTKWAAMQSQTEDYVKRIQQSEDAIIERQLEKTINGQGVDGLSEVPASLRKPLIPAKTPVGAELKARGAAMLEKMLENVLREADTDDLGQEMEFEQFETELKTFLSARVKTYAEVFADLHSPATRQMLELTQALNSM